MAAGGHHSGCRSMAGFHCVSAPHHIEVGLVTRAIHGVGYSYGYGYGWVSGGYGYFWVKRFGAEWVTG